MAGTTQDLDTAADVLAAARDRRAAADRAEVDLLQLAVAWAGMHSVDSIADAAWAGHFGDVALPIAGEGAPLVAEFSIPEFAAAVGLPTEAGKDYLGEALELRYRLPRLWDRVVSGDLPAWRARRIARATVDLSPAAASYVDRHLAPVAHKIRPTGVDRLVEEAIGRFMPDRAEEIRHHAADGRRFEIDHRQVSFAGTSTVYGELDLADALDLDQAIRTIAGEYADLGSTESLDVRRSIAAGELARRQLALDLTTPDPEPVVEGRASKPQQPRRRQTRAINLYVHLSEAALTGAGAECRELAIGRVENTRSMVLVDQIRQWCGHPDAQVNVTGVIDLAEQIRTDQYESPDRLEEQTVLRDGTCVFPWCTRPARACHPDECDCDRDHVIPRSRGGPTETGNIAPLCRRHHRVKTHTTWTYTVLEPGTYLWSSPHAYQFLRDHQGTLDVSRDERRPSGDPPGH